MVLNTYALEPLMQKKQSGKTTELNENNATNAQEIRNTIKNSINM